MIELQAGKFEQVTAVLGGLKHLVHLNAEIDGHHPGRVFADRATRPAVAFVRTQWGYTWLAGDVSNAEFNRSRTNCLRKSQSLRRQLWENEA